MAPTFFVVIFRVVVSFVIISGSLLGVAGRRVLGAEEGAI
jgi:hypothetical protein